MTPVLKEFIDRVLKGDESSYDFFDMLLWQVVANNKIKSIEIAANAKGRAAVESFSDLIDSMGKPDWKPIPIDNNWLSIGIGFEKCDQQALREFCSALGAHVFRAGCKVAMHEDATMKVMCGFNPDGGSIWAMPVSKKASDMVH